MIKLIIVSFSLFLALLANANNIENNNQAVVKAGLQRVLVLRMLKDFTMLGMGITYTDAEANLKNDIKTYETYQELLYNYTDDRDIKKSIEDSNKLWIPIKKYWYKNLKKSI